MVTLESVPHRHDPRDQLQLSYAFQPPDPDRIARAYPPRDWCAWSLEIVRRRARVMEIDNQIFAAVEAARARQLAEARYSEQRRQALAAILYGVVIMVLVIAAAGGRTWILLALGDRSRRASAPGINAPCAG